MTFEEDEIPIDRLVVFTLAGNQINEKVEQINLGPNDMVVVKVPDNFTYADMDDFQKVLHSMKPFKQKILVMFDSIKLLGMTKEELRKCAEFLQNEGGLESDD